MLGLAYNSDNTILTIPSEFRNIAPSVKSFKPTSLGQKFYVPALILSLQFIDITENLKRGHWTLQYSNFLLWEQP